MKRRGLCVTRSAGGSFNPETARRRAARVGQIRARMRGFTPSSFRSAGGIVSGERLSESALARKILMLEDQDERRVALKSWLELEGFEVVAAPGEAALNAASTE